MMVARCLLSTYSTFFFLCASLSLGTFGLATADDWPTWRKNASRMGSSSDELAETLHLQWSRTYPAPQPAWPEDPRLMFDDSYEPIVVGQTLYLASAQTNSVTAMDTSSGKQKWQYFSEGPVRFAPIASQGRIYFGCDDGNLYCLDAEDGRLIWKLNAAPSGRKAIGNDRLISVWPIRGGPVLHENKIYFTAGVWPFEGTFLYAVDLKSDQVPPAYDVTTLPTDVLPQGYLAASGPNLLIPCGRGKVRLFDLTKQKLRNINYDSRRLTDFHVTASGRWMFHGGKVVDLVANKTVPLNIPRPVADGSVLYGAIQGKVIGCADLAKPRVQEEKDGKGKTVLRTRFDAWGLTPILFPTRPKTNELGEEIIIPVTISVKSGGRLYGYSENKLFALDVPTDSSPRPKLAWSKTLVEHPSSIVTADGKLFVTTQEGSIFCFGSEVSIKQFASDKNHPIADDSISDDSALVTDILTAAKVNEGYCIVLGINDGRMVNELVRRSNMRFLVLDNDPQRINQLRRQLTEKGLYGSRVEAYLGEPATFSFPPYLANLIVSEDWSRVGLGQDNNLLRVLYSSLRPYGGVACFQRDGKAADGVLTRTNHLSKSKATETQRLNVLTRVGALEGAGDWTEEYGNAANTLMSSEMIAKPPFGVLWFGGPSSHPDLFYDRHQWASSAIIIHGRMFIEGPQKLTATDVYTGRILWQIPLKEGLSPGRRANWESTGFHFVASSDRIYLTYEKSCQVYDAATGKKLTEFRLPDPKQSFGRIRIWNDWLIVPAFTKHPKYGPVPTQLLAMDRQNGEIKWKIDSDMSFPFVAVGQDKLFVFEGLLGQIYENKTRHGRVPASEQEKALVAFDLRSGEPLWRRPTSRVVTWLAYSEETDVVIASDIMGIEAWRGGDGQFLWDKHATGTGFRGHPENLWDKVILWHDRLLDQRGPGRSYDLVTGDPIQEIHPITGLPTDWEFTKNGHHCNYAIASENMMTFRADSAGYLDLKTSGTSHLRGFRSGCRNSLIPANGLLNAPNFANGCICSYSLFTSLALINVPEAEKWSYSALKTDSRSLQRVGINFGAPGDRRDEEGTLWLNFPNSGGPSPDIGAGISAEKTEQILVPLPTLGTKTLIDFPRPRWFREHALQIDADSRAWIGASGGEGITKIHVPLNNEPGSVGQYRVKLFFFEPDDLPNGERVFDVFVEGKKVIGSFDIAKESGNARQMITREFMTPASDVLRVDLKPIAGSTVISGLEIEKIGGD